MTRIFGYVCFACLVLGIAAGCWMFVLWLSIFDSKGNGLAIAKETQWLDG